MELWLIILIIAAIIIALGVAVYFAYRNQQSKKIEKETTARVEFIAQSVQEKKKERAAIITPSLVTKWGNHWYIFVDTKHVTPANQMMATIDPDVGGSKTFGSSVFVNANGQTWTGCNTKATPEMSHGIFEAFNNVPWAKLYNGDTWAWDEAIADLTGKINNEPLQPGVVTNLNDSGPGSLRDAIDSGCKKITFAVAGNIALSNKVLSVTTDDTVIDGSTAPAGGVCLLNGIRIFANNVTIKHIRIRPDDDAGCLWSAGDKNLVEHCSFSWALDDMVAISGNGTEFRYNIISEPLLPKGKGLNITKDVEGWNGADNADIHHNIIALSYYRNPKFVMGKNRYVRFANNVIHGCEYYTLIDADAGNSQRIDFIGNHYSDTSEMNNKAEVTVEEDKQTTIYLEGNIGPSRMDGDPENWIIHSASRDKLIYAEKPHKPIPNYYAKAQAAYLDVLSRAGAILPKRDAVDQRIVESIKAGAGKRISDPAEVGGWPDLTK